MSHVTTANTQILKPNRKAPCAALRNAQRREMRKNGLSITSAAISATKVNLKPRRLKRWQSEVKFSNNGERKESEMKFLAAYWLELFVLSSVLGGLIGFFWASTSSYTLDEFGRRIEHDD